MIVIKGKHNQAICFTDELEASARKQIETLCDQAAFADSKIRIMPDVHAGMGCTIGTTMTIHDKVVPGMVGVDIGCGMETVRLKEKELDFERLDELIRREIPSGRQVRRNAHPLNADIDLTQLRCSGFVNLQRARLSIGTLGGGNHFIEAGYDEDGFLYLIVHSGSRHLGHETATGYQRLALEQLSQRGDRPGKRKAGRQKAKAGSLPGGLPRDLAYVQGQLMDDYLHDMRLVQRFAMLNRKAIMDVILDGMGLTVLEEFTTIHNYVDLRTNILRKGAVSARQGEKLLIPLNMRDGSLLCEGLGNPDWNFSAPHGAGRVMSRREARQALNLGDFKAQMSDVFTTSISKDTLDEAPMAYKPMEALLKQITPSVRVLKRIKPVYNFKAAE
ncbi:MAG: RtcB family protein [Christensenellales bacterium]